MKKSTPNLAKQRFSEKLLEWHFTDNKREMPWKGERNPYRIWLSEIILQQTRVEQGLNYYQKFITEFPDVFSLANADEQKVFKLWEGLGYYNRCRNLITTAKKIATELNGKFPADYEELLNLKGIGKYTAAAISSFAYGLPYAVVDGNVYRVLSRYFNIATPVDTTTGKKQFEQLAQSILGNNNSAAFNQAIMDFGATVCKPLPECKNCPLSSYCSAYKLNSQADLPVKQKKSVIQKRQFNYYLFRYQNFIAIRQRTSKDIWKDLFEFPMIETGKPVPEIAKAEKQGNIIQISPDFKQQLSHQTIIGKFITVKLAQKPQTANDWIWVKNTELGKFAFPRIINQYLQKSEPDLVNSA